MTKELLIYLDGNIVPESQAKVSVFEFAATPGICIDTALDVIQV